MVAETLAMFGIGDLRVAKLNITWKWNKEKKKEHYKLFHSSYGEFEDKGGWKEATKCCVADKEGNIIHTPLDENIKLMLKGLNTNKYKISECFEDWSMSKDCNNIRALLSKSEEKLRRFGLPENIGIECCSVSDVKKWYKDCSNKIAFKIYFKKSIDLHYEFYCKYHHNGFLIEYNPDKSDICPNNIYQIKKWLENLK